MSKYSERRGMQSAVLKVSGEPEHSVEVLNRVSLYQNPKKYKDTGVEG